MSRCIVPDWLSLPIFAGNIPWRGEAAVWALPALVIGAFLRILLISYLPYSFWGADTRSHFSFAQEMVGQHRFHMEEKRRFLYPILMVPVTLLPGAPIRWLSLFQHTLGVISLLPLSYIIRKTLATWRWWIVPLTVFYSACPVMLVFEHEMVGGCLLFNSYLWSFAGSQAWVTQSEARRTERWYWLFYVSFAALILTKPAAVSPGGVLLAIAFLPAARASLRRGRLVAFILLILVTPFVGSRKLGSLMLYTATFPLTRLDSPQNAEYKAEVRSMVEKLQPRLDVYYLLDDPPFDFVFRGLVDESRPAWARLVHKHPKERAAVCLSLATEAIRDRPGAFLAFGMQRLIASCNLSFSSYPQFTGAYFRRRERLYYEEANSGKKVAFAWPSTCQGTGRCLPTKNSAGGSNLRSTPGRKEFSGR